MLLNGDNKSISIFRAQYILNLIKKHETILSSELVDITGFKPSTVFNIVQKLSSESLIINVGKGESTEKGGKRPFMWKINGDAAYVIGIDIEIDALTLVVLDLCGKRIWKKGIKFDKIETTDKLVSIITDIVNEAITSSGIQREKVLGMGIALPGIVDSQQKVIIRNDVLSEKNIPLADRLSEIFHFLIIVENNANATTIGEQWVGSAKGFKNFLLVLVEFERKVGGMGIGMVIDEHSYFGHTHCAGELNIPLMNLSQMMVFFRDELENSESLKQFDNNPDNIETDLLIEAAKNGDSLAISVFEKLGDEIGRIISQSVALLNPEALILAGAVSELNEIITRPIENVIKLKTLPYINKHLIVQTSAHGAYSVSIGAASLILNEFFKIPVINE